MRTVIASSVVCLALVVVSCGYRFVDPSSGPNYALAEVRNITAEPGLDRILSDGLNDLESFHPEALNRLTIIVTHFDETVAAVDSEGLTIRERLKLEIDWKVQGADGSQATFGKEIVTKTYPYSEDPATLNWNRSAAIRLLTNSAAERILDRLKVLP